MTIVQELKLAQQAFYCEVKGLDTEKVYVTNGGKPGSYTLLSPNKPLQLINVRQGGQAREVQAQNTFTVPAHQSAGLLICNHTATYDQFYTTTLNHIYLEEGAQLRVLVMQNEHNGSQHFSTMQVEQGKNSRFTCTVATLYGGVVDNRFEVELQGEGAECELNGIFLSDKEQRVVNTVHVHHAAPKCRSIQLFKGVLNDSATGRFNGHILVDKGAQKTEAFQANHNLLLTHTAKMFTDPHLEIYADDVKCSHGATIGRIDENALFYLRSRGVSLAEARMLQQLAFAHDVIDRITIKPLRERIAALVEMRLRGDLLPCGDCACHCC